MSNPSLPPDVLAHLRGLFVEEADQTMREAQEHCARWEPGAAPPHRIRSVLHGLKGAAAAVELPELAQMIHRAEDLVRTDGDPAKVGSVLRALRDVFPLARAPEGLPPTALDELSRLLQASAQAAPSAAPARAETTPARPARAQAVRIVEHTAVSSSALAESVRLAAELRRALSDVRRADRTEDALHRAAVHCEELESLLERMRQSPGAEAVEGLEEEVAQLAASLGKKVTLVVHGRDIRVERRALQQARGTLRHLVRNALDHGLETPAERLRVGKPETGRLTVRLSVDLGRLRVELSDDGRGFDVEAIRYKLAPTLSPEELLSISDRELLRRFALQGGSTREQVSEISGRGVGLSSVARSALDAGGTFDLQSTRGKGTTLVFTFPVGAYVAELLTFVVSGVQLALPTSSILATARRRAEGDEVQTPVGAVVQFAGTVARKIDLGALLGFEAAEKRAFVLMMQVAEHTLALAIDEIGTVHRVVPRNAPPLVKPGALVSGLAVLPDVGAVQLLNPERLLEAALAQRQVSRPAPRPAERDQPAAKGAPARRLEVLLVEDSAATREVYRVLLEAEGYRVRTAVDGGAGLAAAVERPPDVILSDVDMPVKTGFELARGIRSHPKTARTPVILLTSRDDAGSRAEGAASGADAYLLKGTFTPAAFKDTLARLGVGIPA